MSIAASYSSNVTAVETLETGVPAAAEANRKVTHNLFNTLLNSVEGVTAVAYFEVELAAGAGSVDFTALPQVNGAELDATGMVVKLIKVIADAENSGDFAVEVGDSNGIDLGVQITDLGPGLEVVARIKDVAVEADKKILDLSGTGTDKAAIVIWLGEAPE